MDWLYLFKISISFSILYLIYYIFFRKTTCHKTNRFYLLSVILLSIILPFINFSKVYSGNTVLAIKQINLIDYEHFIANNPITVSQASNNHSVQQLLLYIYLSGVLLFTVIFIKNLSLLIKQRFKNTVIKNNTYTYILHQNNNSAYSFFHWLYVPKNEYINPNSPIIEHEKVHANQLHSLDIIITEIFSIALWFLPFVYGYKKSLRNIHEYLADESLTKNDTSKIAYLKLLAIQTERLALSQISNTFYSASIKKRILMLTKPSTTKYKQLKYLIIVPVLFLMTIAVGQINDLDATAKSTVSNTQMINNQNPIFIYPIKKGDYRITSTFGKRMHPIKKKMMMHNAIDFAAPTGTEVKASADGIVLKKEFIEGSYGNIVAIQHSNGFVSVYSQLSEFKTDIGKTVKQGELIGLVGSSGMSTGPHLHFEIRKNGEYVNPDNYLK